MEWNGILQNTAMDGTTFTTPSFNDKQQTSTLQLKQRVKREKLDAL